VALLVGCTNGNSSGVLEGVAPVPVNVDVSGETTLQPSDLPEGVRSLRFGITPYLNQQVIREQYKPVAEYLARTLGIKVELFVAKSYQEHIERIVGGELDIVSLSPLSYVSAMTANPKIQIFAHELAHGNTSFSSYVMVPSESSFATLEELKGRRMVFVDELSTSGFLFPYAAFLNNGVDPETDFSQIRFAGSHLQAIVELSLGNADAIATGSGMLEEAAKHKYSTGPIDIGDFRILFKAGRIPFDAVCAREGFPRSGVKKLQAAFVRLNTRTPQGRRVLSRTAGISGFIPAVDSLYDVVRRTLKQVVDHRGNRR
jgi:phosphonate transport system substrate-binding protein